MALINPIRGIHFNPKSVRLADTIIPPYDAIPKGKEKSYLDRSPYNFAHIILPNPADPNYDQAAQRLKNWKTSGILVEDHEPRFYLYRQAFELGRKHHVRDTLMCAVQLHDFQDGHIRPHENTYQKYKTDRLNVLRKTQHQMSHIFGMVKDSSGKLKELFDAWSFETAFLTATDDEKTQHALWKVPSRFQSQVQSLVEGPIYIVDGHHRYSSALEYAREVGALGSQTHPAGQMLFCISNVYDPALIVFPTHRLIRTAENKISLDPYSQTEISEQELREFSAATQGGTDFVLYQQGKLTLCSPLDRSQRSHEWGNALSKLGVAWGDWDLLTQIGINDSNRSERVFYERDFDKAWAMRNEYAVTLFHGPISPERVCEVADEKGFMPQKTTYFYPKLAAGLIIRNVTA